MTNNTLRFSDLSERFGKMVREVVNALVQWAKEVWRRFKCLARLKIDANTQFIKNYEKNIARHKHNQYTRSTWKVDWNTRKSNQWMNHKPVFAVRKILR